MRDSKHVTLKDVLVLLLPVIVFCLRAQLSCRAELVGNMGNMANFWFF